MQEGAADPQPKNALDARALHPTRRARAPRPAAAPDMRRPFDNADDASMFGVNRSFVAPFGPASRLNPRPAYAKTTETNRSV
jgi:hypothetical protein